MGVTNMRIFLLLTVLAGLIGGIAPTLAQPSAIFVPLPSDFSSDFVFKQEHLQFSIIRGPKSNTIIAWGGVGEGDSVRFALALTEGKPVAEVQLFSPGGYLAEGLKIGTLIRNRALATRVVAGAECVSACNFMFMGGVVRTVEPNGSFIVHMFSNNSARLLLNDLRNPPKSVEEFNDRYPQFKLRNYVVAEKIAKLNQVAQDGIKTVPNAASAPTAATTSNENITIQSYIRDFVVPDNIIDMRVKDIQQNSAQTAAVIAEFLLHMRMPLRFLTEFANIPNSEPRALTPQELKDFNIVN